MTNFTRDYAKREDVELTDVKLYNSVSGTAVQDDDSFSSASSTKLASSESIKAYVDANSGGGGGSSVAELVPKFLATFTNSSDASSLYFGGNTYINTTTPYDIYYLVLENVVPTTDASLLMQLHRYWYGGNNINVSSGYRQMTYFIGQKNNDNWETSYLSSTTDRTMWSICGGYNNNNLRVDNSTSYKGYNGTWRLDNAYTFVSELYPRLTMVDQIRYHSSAGYTMGYMYAYKNMWCEGFGSNRVNGGRIYFSTGSIRSGAKIHLYGANYG